MGQLDAAYYSFVASGIYLRCFLKASDEDIDFLQRGNIVPPEHMRKRDLAHWIDGAKAGWFAKRTVVFESRPVPPPMISPWAVVSYSPTETSTESRLAVSYPTRPHSGQ